MGRGKTVRPDRAREIFLAVLAERCNVSEACRAAGIGRSTVYQWREAEPEFAEAWKAAEDEAADKLEAEAWRRGVDGVDKPVTFQGQITTTYREYSDRMLEILLKAHRPMYREKQAVELSGPNGSPIEYRAAAKQEIADLFGPTAIEVIPQRG